MKALIPTGGRRSRHSYIWSKLEPLDIGGRAALTAAELGCADAAQAAQRVSCAIHDIFGPGKFATQRVPAVNAVTVVRLAR